MSKKIIEFQQEMKTCETSKNIIRLEIDDDDDDDDDN